MHHQDTISSWSLAALTYFSRLHRQYLQEWSFLDNQFNVIQSQFLLLLFFVFQRWWMHYLSTPRFHQAPVSAHCKLSAFAVVALFLSSTETAPRLYRLYNFSSSSWKNRYKMCKSRRKIIAARKKKNPLIVLLWFSLGRIVVNVSNFMAIKINLKIR